MESIIPSGEGVTALLHRHVRRDLRLVHRAIDEDWELTPAKKAALIRWLAAVMRAGHDTHYHRATLSAARDLIDADGSDVRADARALRLLERLRARERKIAEKLHRTA